MKNLTLPMLVPLCACTVAVPDSDATAPTLVLSMFDPQITTIASSDPNATLPRGCPAGSSANIIDVEAYFDRIDPAYVPPLNPATFESETYFYKSAETATKFWVVANDPEGVFSIRAIGHAHPSGDPRANDFDTRAGANIPEHVGDYTPSPGTSVEYGVRSPFDPNLGDVPIFSHDLRIEEGFEEEEDGSFTETLKDGGVLMFAPTSLSGGPVIYASAANAADDGTTEVTRIAVKLLPRSLCRPDADG